MLDYGSPFDDEEEKRKTFEALVGGDRDPTPPSVNQNDDSPLPKPDGAPDAPAARPAASMSDFGADPAEAEKAQTFSALLDGAGGASTQVGQTGRSMQSDNGPAQAPSISHSYATDDPEKPKTPPAADGSDGAGSMLNIGTLIALGLDAHFNKARGAGQIIGATANNIAEDKRAAAEHLERLAHDAREAHSAANDPLRIALAQQGIDLRAKAIKDKEDAAAQHKVEYNDKGDPGSEHTKGVVTTAGDIAGVKQARRDAARHEDAPAANQDAVDRAAGIVTGTTAPKVAQAQAIQEATTPGAVERSGLSAAAAERGRQDVVHGNAPRTADDQAEAEGKKIRAEQTAKGATTRVPGMVTDDPEAFRVTDRAKAEGLSGQALTAENAFDTMEEILQRHHDQGGKNYELTGTDKAQYDQARSALSGAASTVGHYGVVNEKEYERFAKTIPDLSPNLKNEAYDVFDKYVSGNPDANNRLDIIKGAHKGMQSLFNSDLKPHGLSIDVGQGAPPSAAPATGAGANEPSEFDGKPTGGGLTTTGKPPPLPDDAVSSRRVGVLDQLMSEKGATDRKLTKVDPKTGQPVMGKNGKPLTMVAPLGPDGLKRAARSHWLEL